MIVADQEVGTSAYRDEERIDSILCVPIWLRYAAFSRMPDLSKSTVDWATLTIGGLGIIVSVVVALAVYWRTKRSTQKGLTYDYTSAKLVTTDHPFGGELRIFFS